MQMSIAPKKSFVFVAVLAGLSAQIIAQENPLLQTYFKTHWQNESQFIVEAITTDIAEMLCFAKSKKLPGEARLAITAAEKAPFYKIGLQLPEGAAPVISEINMSRPIWEPELYQPLIRDLLKALDVPRQLNPSPDETNLGFLKRLESATAQDIEQANAELSQELTGDFRNPALHERAAVLLGVFALRESSGHFYDVRLPLCRMTAHLALARSLRKDSAYSVHGRLAEAILYTLMNNQRDALGMLARLEKAEPQLIRWTTALKARNTADYRLIKLNENSSLLEAATWCFAYCYSVDSTAPWEKLMEKPGRERVDYCRIINSMGYSVGIGHGLLKYSLPLEFKEIDEVSRLALKTKLGNANLISELNRMPERCFSGSRDQPGVRVIGWGQWAMFFQRHLCHAMENNFYFMYKKWGVPEDAKKFSVQSDQMLTGMRLYPFVQRVNCTDKASYHRSVDGGLAVTLETPHLVSPMSWNYLLSAVSFAEPYRPNPNPHFNEWFRHNPPQGTAYDARPRLEQPSLARRPDVVSELERLHEIAPWDYYISDDLLRKKYNRKADFAQVEQVFHPVIDYAAYPMVRLANLSSDNPSIYEKWMLKAAELDAFRYLTLGEHFCRNDEVKAAAYLEKGIRLCPDAVAGAARAGWLVRYYQKNGQIKKAEALSDWAAEVYSQPGLEAKAQFLESTGRYAEAFVYYNKIKERYDTAADLLAFCSRYKAKTGDPRYDSVVKKELNTIFPTGIEQVKLMDFHSAPSDGVMIHEDNELLQQAGLHKGDIIVAVYGIRARNFEQYNYGRDSNSAPEMNLIVWKTDHYLEVKASPPDHRFNAQFKTWHRGA